MLIIKRNGSSVTLYIFIIELCLRWRLIIRFRRHVRRKRNHPARDGFLALSAARWPQQGLLRGLPLKHKSGFGGVYGETDEKRSFSFPAGFSAREQSERKNLKKSPKWQNHLGEKR